MPPPTRPHQTLRIVKWIARPTPRENGFHLGCLDVGGTGYHIAAWHYGDENGWGQVIELDPVGGGPRVVVEFGPDGAKGDPVLCRAVRRGLDILETFELREAEARAAYQTLATGVPYGSWQEGLR